MKHVPKVFSDWAKPEDFPSFNWDVSISIDCFNFADTTPYRIFVQMEPPMIRNLEADIIKHKNFYDLILTWSPEILSYCGNSILFPFGCGWTHNPDISQKKYQASFLISSKSMCEGHGVRKYFFDTLPDNLHGLPIIKYQSPPYLPSKESMLVPFQYSIAMENARMTNFFTEKLVDCFMTMTVPIYWGCLNVKDFFNPEGILQFETYKELLECLTRCTPDFYESKKAVIEENYKLGSSYFNLGERVHRAVNDVWEHPEKIGKWRIR